MEAVTTTDSKLAELPTGSELIWLTANGITESSESFGRSPRDLLLYFRDQPYGADHSVYCCGDSGLFTVLTRRRPAYCPTTKTAVLLPQQPEITTVMQP